MEVSAAVKTLLQANELKQTLRTGWVRRGVANAENVAAHSYGVAFTALLLADLVDEPLDLGRLLAMAILHDLPESLTSDIPTPAWRRLPPGSKRQAERAAMEEIAQLGATEGWLVLWDELRDQQSLEAKVVHDADRLDMFLQALVYEQQTGNRRLAEFWARLPDLHTRPAQLIYQDIRRLRDEL